MRKFIGWLGGIASAVITAVLIYHFTVPTPASPPTTFEGMVIDGQQSVPIKQAMVEFEVEPNTQGSGPFHDFTDENGSYKIEVSDLPPTVKVTLHAQANGYQHSRAVSLTSIRTDNRNDFELKPVVTPESQPPAHTTPTPVPTATPTATPAAATGHPPLNKLVYVPKTFSQKFSFKAAK